VHDEINTLESALRLGLGVLPSSYLHGPIVFIILFVVNAAYYLIGVLSGGFKNLESFTMHYVVNPQSFYLISKISMAAISILILIAIYKLANIFYDKKSAFISVFLTGTLFLFVFHSTLLKDDLVATFFVVVAHYFIFLFLKEENYKRLYLASFFCGAAISSKLTALPLVIALYLFYFIYILKTDEAKRGYIRIIFAGLIMSFCICLGVIVFNPFILLTPQILLESINALVSKHTDVMRNDFGFFWAHLVPLALGFGLTILSYIAFLFFMFKRRYRVLYLLIFPLSLYVLFHKRGGAVYHILPALPFFIIGSAVFLSEFLNKKFKAGKIIVFALIVTAVLPSLTRGIKTFRILNGADTRQQAVSWIENNVRENKTIYMEGGVRGLLVMGPSLIPNKESLENQAQFIKKIKGNASLTNLIIKHDLFAGKKRYNIIIEEGEIEDVGKVLNLNPDYIILSGVYDAPVQYILMTSRKKIIEERRKRIDVINKYYDQVEVFSPYPEITAFFPLLTVSDFINLDKVSLFSKLDFRAGPEVKILVRNKEKI
jgi:hypothetical protein